MVNFLLKVVLRADEPSVPIMRTSHHSSVNMGRMMGLEVGDTGPYVWASYRTKTSRLPSSLLLSSVSRKGSAPSSSCSTVNLMVGLTPLRWQMSSSVEPFLKRVVGVTKAVNYY